MDALAFALLVAFSLLAGWVIRALAGDRPILPGIFRYWGPDWPSGVQEDDDLHWRWQTSAPARRARTEPVHGRVHAGGRPGTPG